MPGVHHVACTTDDPGAVAEVLDKVFGMRETAPVHAEGSAASALLGWPENGGFEGFMTVGTGRGMVEVIPIPEELRGIAPSGVALVSFAVGDIEERVARVRALGIEITPPVRVTNDTVDVSLARFVVGGIPFELMEAHR